MPTPQKMRSSLRMNRHLVPCVIFVLFIAQPVLSQGMLLTPDVDYNSRPRYRPTRATEVITREVDGRLVSEIIVVDGPLPNLPPTADLSRFAPAPGLQSFGDCVAWATAYCCMTIQVAEWRGVEIPSAATDVFSPRFVYSQINTGTALGGSFIYRNGTSAVGLLSSEGCSSELLTPYLPASADSAGWSRQPDTRASSEAKNYRTFHHAVCENVDDIRYALVFGVPVVIAVRVDQAFNQHQGADLYRWQGGTTGYHALCVIGYDNQKQAFRVQNSWGQQWGDGGRFWVGYDEFQKLSGSERGNGWCIEAHAISADASRGSQVRRTKTPAATYFFLPDGSIKAQGSNETIADVGDFTATESTDYFLYGLRQDGTILGRNTQWFDITSPDFPSGLSGGRGRMIASSQNYLYTLTQNGNVLGRVPLNMSSTGSSYWEMLDPPSNRKPIDIRCRSGIIYVETDDGILYRRIPGSGWSREN